MRKLLPALSIALLLLPAVPQPASAVARKSFYEGTTSQGFPWAAKIVELPTGQLALKALAIELAISCPSGLNQTGGGVIGSPIPDPLDGNRTWTYADVSGEGAVHATVTFGTPSADGSVSFGFPGLDQQGDPELCSTGQITLAGTRIRGGSLSLTSSSDARFSFKMTRSSGGALTTLLSSAPATAKKKYVRLYRGQTDQGGPAAFQTKQGSTTTRLISLLESYRVVCDDSSVQDWFVFYGFLPGIALQGHQFDFQDHSEFGRVDVAGRLGLHAGSGTTSFSFAQFEAGTESPELCSSSTFGWSVGRKFQREVRRAVMPGWRYERV